MAFDIFINVYIYIYIIKMWVEGVRVFATVNGKVLKSD